jgi:hypothetical protein
MNKLDELKKQLYVDTSGRWVSTKDLDGAFELLVVDVIQHISINATAFDGDVQRGMKTAARLVKEFYLQETP